MGLDQKDQNIEANFHSKRFFLKCSEKFSPFLEQFFVSLNFYAKKKNSFKFFFRSIFFTLFIFSHRLTLQDRDRDQSEPIQTLSLIKKDSKKKKILGVLFIYFFSLLHRSFLYRFDIIITYLLQVSSIYNLNLETNIKQWMKL